MNLYDASGLNSFLSQSLKIDSKKYILFGDSGYYWRVFGDTPSSGVSLTVAKRAFKKKLLERCGSLSSGFSWR